MSDNQLTVNYEKTIFGELEEGEYFYDLEGVEDVDLRTFPFGDTDELLIKEIHDGHMVDEGGLDLGKWDDDRPVVRVIQVLMTNVLPLIRFADLPTPYFVHPDYQVDGRLQLLQRGGLLISAPEGSNASHVRHNMFEGPPIRVEDDELVCPIRFAEPIREDDPVG